MTPTASPAPPRLGFGSAGMAMTPEEFDAVTEYDPGYRYELIRGVLVVSPIPSEAEASPDEELGYMLRTYRDTHPLGAALDETLAERYVPTANRRRADRVVWAGLGRRPDPATDVPTIVVEFVSAGKRNQTRDYIEKLQEYRDAGVREYWVVDRFRRTLTVYRDAGQEVVAEDGLYRTDLLPGFELSPARLLAAADRWSI